MLQKKKKKYTKPPRKRGEEIKRKIKREKERGGNEIDRGRLLSCKTFHFIEV